MFLDSFQGDGKVEFSPGDRNREHTPFSAEHFSRFGHNANSPAMRISVATQVEATGSEGPST